MSQEMLAPSAADSHAASQEFSEVASSEVEVEPVVLYVGQQLRATREAKNMSAADVAKALKLSVHQVVALEEDDWSRLPVTIIRGFVRNYARLLKLDPEPLMHALNAVQMPKAPELDFPERINTTMPDTGRVERRDYAAAFSGLALVLLALLAYFFLPQDFWQSTLMTLTSAGKPAVVTSEAPGATPEANVSAPALSPPESAPAATAMVAPAPSPETGAQPPSTQPSAASASASVPGSGLKLSFAEPSWVEIRDRSGEVVFSQLNPAGSQRDIEGQPPFALVIGNSTHVTVQYKGKVVELSQRSKDDVARLNLD